MEQLEEALVSYVSLLSEYSGNTKHAGNRSRYERHLAQAALMFLALRGKQPLRDLKRIVEAERRSFGWDFMEGEDGKTIESAFHAFAALVEGT